mgnify:CR=1 FL=1
MNKIIFKIIIVLLLLSCTEKRNIGEIEIQFNDSIALDSVFSITNSEGSMITDFNVDSDGNLYLIDIANFKLSKYNSKGELLGVDSKRDFVILYNFKSQILSYYNLNLEFQFTELFSNHVIDISDEVNGQIVLGFMVHKGEDPLILLSYESEIRQDIAVEQFEKNPVWNMFSIDQSEDYIYMSYRFLNLIRKLDKQGNIVWERAFKNWPKKSKVIENLSVPNEILIRDIEVTENDKILVLGGVYSSNDAQDIHVLSNEGNYLYSVKLPYRTPSIVYKKGYLYSSTNLGSKVIKWKVDF